MSTKRSAQARRTAPAAPAEAAAKTGTASQAPPPSMPLPPPTSPKPVLEPHAPVSVLVAAATIDKILEMAREKPFADAVTVERVLRVSFETIAKHDTRDALKLPPWLPRSIVVGGLAGIAAYSFYMLGRNKEGK